MSGALGQLSHNSIAWVAYNKRIVLLTVPGSGKAKIKADLGSGEAPFLVHRWLAVCSGGGRGKGALWGPFIFFINKGTNPIYKSSTFMAKSPPKGPTSGYHGIGVRFQPMTLGGDTSIHGNTRPLPESQCKSGMANGGWGELGGRGVFSVH